MSSRSWNKKKKQKKEDQASSSSSSSSSSSASASASAVSPSVGNGESGAGRPTSVAILVSRKLGGSASGGSGSGGRGVVRLAVAVREARKRTSAKDGIMYTIHHYDFIDDRRRFTNLDALLTRLVAPVSVVHVACTESAHVTDGKKKQQVQRCREVSDILSKIQAVIDSRRDLLTTTSLSDSGGQEAAPNTTLANVLYDGLPRALQNPSQAVDYADRTLCRLLGGETSEGFLAYRGDRQFMAEANDSLPKRAVALLLYQEEGEECHGSAGAGSSTLPLFEDKDNHNQATHEILSGTLTSHLSLDRIASECINLLPPPRGSGKALVDVGGTESNNSIFGILHKCCTKMGSRLLQLWLRQPLVNLSQIVARQNAVARLVHFGLERDQLRQDGLMTLSNVDLDSLCSKFLLAGSSPPPPAADATQDSVAAATSSVGVLGGTAAALESLYKLHLLASQQLPALIQTLEAVTSATDPDDLADKTTCTTATATTSAPSCHLQDALVGLQIVHTELQVAAKLVETVLDFDAAPRDFRIRSTFNDDLASLKEELDHVEEELDEIHKAMDTLWSETSGSAAGQVRLEVCSSSGGETTSLTFGGAPLSWQFRLPDTNSAKTLQEPPLASHVTVHRLLKNGVYFTNKALRQLGSKRHDLLAEYDRLQQDVVKHAMVVAVTYVPVLERTSSLIATVDVLSSFAHVAAYSPHGYCRPEMTDGEEDGMGIELKNARHPCVELQDGVNFIANDVRLVFGSCSFLLVTGPNMGGKSTYIRALGAIVTMAQVGSFVPCSWARINIVHHILARVGAGDVQDRGISTFMAEMLEASSILRTATRRSLICIDELGRGTSTFDGLGLATAISQYIVQHKKCMTVFATHFHELTALAQTEASVQNCHVTARRATNDGTNGLTFLYEVRPGPCLESFGIQVAELANCPPEVIANAKRKAKELENFDHGKRRRHRMEEQEEAQAFMDKFKSLPLQSLATREEKRAAILQLLQESGVPMSVE